ncbi:MAG: hypothetical protein WAN86_23760 [Hyphomicrobiaceae bacterium]
MTIKSAFLGLVRSVVPERLRPYGYLIHLARTRTSCTVWSGPFQGMHVQGRTAIPQLLGTFERELAPYIERAVERQPRLVVNLGAADGYYAIGMARRLPHARVLAFEMEARGRDLLQDMATLNAVDNRVSVLGKCEPEDLASALENDSDALVICDVEGYEEKLLNPVVVPALRRLPILVELHDFIGPNVTELLSRRFGATHDITHIWQQDRSVADFPCPTPLTALLRSRIERLLSEERQVRMAWFWMEPRRG